MKSKSFLTDDRLLLLVVILFLAYLAFCSFYLYNFLETAENGADHRGQGAFFIGIIGIIMAVFHMHLAYLAMSILSLIYWAITTIRYGKGKQFPIIDAINGCRNFSEDIVWSNLEPKQKTFLEIIGLSIAILSQVFCFWYF